MIDLYTVEFNALTNDQRYSAIADFAHAQPNESNRHDFKLIWTNDALKDVAAFANAFGGLLIIGVEKGQDDTDAKLVGVKSTSEILTGIASAIATNISPTPAYDLMECQEPGDTKKRFCVVRVRNDSTLHLVTKKDISPVWVRNADQTIRADAAQLRMLIDRERQSITNTEQLSLERAGKLLEEMPIGLNYPDKPEWTRGPWNASVIYFKLALVPTEKRWIPLDVREENKFVNLIHTRYRRIASSVTGAQPVARDAPNRSAEFFEYRWYHKDLNYESRWRITNLLEIACATQILYERSWSLVDVVMYAILLLRIGAEWWKGFNYFGDAILFCELSVDALYPLARGKANQFIKLFGPGEGNYGMRAEILQAYPQQRNESKAYAPINSATVLDNIPRIVTSLMNPLLRTLGHAVHWDEFEENVRLIAQGQ